MTRTISLQARMMSVRLGLGDLIHQPACKGYANCCQCPECAAQQDRIAEHQKAGRNAFSADGTIRPRHAARQPWQHAA